MSAMLPNQPKRYSYADYLQWAEGERIELIHGFPYEMVAAPSRQHQQVVLEFGRVFANFLKGKECEVYIAPFDVRLPEHMEDTDAETYTVVQPDLVVVCDLAKLDDHGCKGVPDLIIEVISPSTASHDYIKKMALYEQHGVKEYWIVHPVDQLVMVHTWSQGQFGRPRIYDSQGTIKVDLIEGFEIELQEIFT